MRCVKSLIWATVVVAALLAVAGTASATAVTSPTGTALATGSSAGDHRPLVPPHERFIETLGHRAPGAMVAEGRLEPSISI